MGAVNMAIGKYTKLEKACHVIVPCCVTFTAVEQPPTFDSARAHQRNVIIMQIASVSIATLFASLDSTTTFLCVFSTLCCLAQGAMVYQLPSVADYIVGIEKHKVSYHP